MTSAATNKAVNGALPVDSEHVMAATNVRRGATPAVWKDGQPPGYAGQWDSVDPGGPADFSTGEIDGEFENGPARWEQI